MTVARQVKTQTLKALNERLYKFRYNTLFVIRETYNSAVHGCLSLFTVVGLMADFFHKHLSWSEEKGGEKIIFYTI